MSGNPDSACGRCGAPVFEADLESGASVLLFGKRFCPACKKQAIDDVSLEELSEPPPPPAATPPAVPPPPSAPAAADPDAKARSAWTALEPTLRRSDVPFDVQLAAIERARPACKGTAYEAKLDEARTRVLQEKDGVDAGKRIGAVLDTLKKIAQEDKDFARYGEFQDLAQSARDLAARSTPAQVSEINRLQADYAGRYEKAAEPYFAEIEPAASGLASEKRFDAALAKIETFPARFRRSGAWRGLERLKQQIERDRK